jgi:hypothetical protein
MQPLLISKNTISDYKFQLMARNLNNIYSMMTDHFYFFPKFKLDSRMVSSMGDTTIPSSIPLELVDDTELEAIEAALALATSASKRLRTSPPEATWTENNADSAGRRLPVWANHAARDQARANPSNHSRDATDSLSINTDHCFAQYNEPQGRRFESQQRPASSLSVSTEAQS